MGARLPLVGLAMDSPLAHPDAANYCPASWPPKDDWPVIVDKAGNVVSRWGDSIWVLDPWAKKRMVLNFGDGPVDRTDPIDKANADLLRQITGWWLYGPGAAQSPRTLLTRFSVLRPIFALCSAEGIVASDLVRFPLVADRLPDVLMASMSEAILSLLHELYAISDKLGFVLLDQTGMARLAAALPEHHRKQTPYIPPRIWRYQVTRLKECLDDFLAHRDQIGDCFRFCLEAYITNYGSLAHAKSTQRDRNLRPFLVPDDGQSSDKHGRLTLGTFEETAERFGIADLLRRWTGTAPADQQPIYIDSLSTYFNLVGYAGLAYILNFSLMRCDESMTLPADCLRIEQDPRFGAIHMLQGPTTKTVKDDEAIWITSPSVQDAVVALCAIGDLRRLCALELPEPSPLFWRQNEPWAGGVRAFDENVPSRMKSYSFLMANSPKLFDLDQLRITERDLELARLATPTLSDHFIVGEVWPLAWHQLRRTGAVNMQASGLVSDASLQFQLKHLSRVMSLYYGQNHATIKLEENAQSLYIQTMYEVLGRELQQLASDRFVSPHGEKRKQEIVRLISVSDLKASVRLAKKGGVACREMLFGVCTSNVPCQYGGVESIGHCGGGETAKPCAGILYDKTKFEQVIQLERLLDERLEKAPEGSPLHGSLMAQKRSVQNYYRATRQHG